jgi:hypothetical protein
MSMLVMTDAECVEQCLQSIESALFALGATKCGPTESHAGYNLEGALIDAKEGRFDQICIDTMERVTGQIHAAMHILREGANAISVKLYPIEDEI